MDHVVVCMDFEVAVTASQEELAEQIGSQGIMDSSDSSRPFYYLAALALECEDDDYTIEETLVEFVENADLDLNPMERREVVEVLD